MKAHELELTAKPNRKRVGRGISAGGGKTAGRGTKGQNSRTGGGVRPGFEGGQNPLAKRLPKKRGFASLDHVTYQVVNLELLDQQKEGTVLDATALVAAGLVKSLKNPIKVLGSGTLTKKLTLKVQAASASARTAIEKAGGTIEIVTLPKTPKKATRPGTKA
jgi:large subunit ribosomal protein L15